MTPEQFDRAEEIFHAASGMPLDQRARFLDEACGGDEELRREVESLLAVASDPPSYLDRSLVGAEVVERLDVSDREITLPYTIGSYRLIRQVGHGGMGTVYEAEQAGVDRRVAIKIMRPAMATAVFLRRFRAEQRILAGLEHPGIARLYDAGTTTTGLPYLSMEFVDGANLLAYCAERRLGLIDRIHLFERVCDAVQYAHQHLVVHRDLKPSNIMVTRDGEPKLLDFGIAKLLHPSLDQPEAGATVTGLRLMTPEYASPEQIRGDQVTTASDVYSLGVVLYELVTGTRVYRTTAQSAHEMERAVLDQVPTKPSTAVMRAPGREAGDEWTFPVTPRKHAAGLRGDLDNIILRALAKDPATRYATADDLAEDLRRHRTGLPVLARADSLTYRSRKFVNRHRWAVASTIAVVVALLVAVVMTLNAAAEARRERDLAARRFGDVRQLANVFLFDVEQKIRDIAGTTEARQLLVTTGLSYLDRLAADAGNDPSLLREVAAGYDRLGDVQGALLASNLGQSANALASYEKASALRQRLLDVPTTPSPEILRESAQGELRLAQAMLRVGRVKDAPGHSGRALQLLDRVGAPTGTVESVRERGEALGTHGFLLAVAGNVTGGLVFLRQAVALYETLPPERLSEPQLGRGYALALFRTIQVLDELPDKQSENEAIALAPRVIALDRKLLAAEPNRADLRRGLSRDIAMFAELLWGAGRHEEVLEQFKEVTALLEGDVALDPGDRLARRSRAVVHARTARSLIALNRHEEAHAVVEPALGDITDLLREDPKNLTIQVTFGEVALQLARAGAKLAEERQGQERSALLSRIEPPLVKAIDIYEPLVTSKTLTGGDALVLDEAKAVHASIKQLKSR